jgi:hypothetical protein
VERDENQNGLKESNMGMHFGVVAPRILPDGSAGFDIAAVPPSISPPREK